MKAQFEDHGSIWLLRPLDVEAQELVMDRVGPDTQWLGDALVVEPRFVDLLAGQLAADGVEVEIP